jgi:hypothetical protein
MRLIEAGAAILVLGLAGCATTTSHEPQPAPKTAITLDDGQARTALVGNKFKGVTRTGEPYSIEFREDGTDVYTQSRLKPQTERWTLTNGVVCIEMKDYPKECSQVKVVNNEFWFVDPANAEIHNHLTLTP